MGPPSGSRPACQVQPVLHERSPGPAWVAALLPRCPRLRPRDHPVPLRDQGAHLLITRRLHQPRSRAPNPLDVLPGPSFVVVVHPRDRLLFIGQPEDSPTPASHFPSRPGGLSSSAREPQRAASSPHRLPEEERSTSSLRRGVEVEVCVCGEPARLAARLAARLGLSELLQGSPHGSHPS